MTRLEREWAGRVGERGQASVELLGLLPLLIVLGLAVLQLLAVGYASVLAGSASEAGALAMAAGGDARAGVREALPGWSRSRAKVEVVAGEVKGSVATAVAPARSVRTPGGLGPRRGGGTVTGRAPDSHRGSLMAGVLAGAEGFFLKPVEPAGAHLPAASQATRLVIAVYGLRRGCGTTFVARALAAELAARDGAGAAAVMCEARASAIPLATPDASRLARAFEELPGAVTRAVGRLALVDSADPLAVAESARHLAPLVVDAGASALGGVPAALADLSVVVTVPAIEPALALVAVECLERVGPKPVVVINRGDRPGRELGLGRRCAGPAALSSRGCVTTCAYSRSRVLARSWRSAVASRAGSSAGRWPLWRTVVRRSAREEGRPRDCGPGAAPLARARRRR